MEKFNDGNFLSEKTISQNNLLQSTFVFSHNVDRIKFILNIINNFQDMATYHTNLISSKKICSSIENSGWIISQWHIELALPKIMPDSNNVTLNIKSRTALYKSLQVRRTFNLSSSDFSVIGRAISNWVLFSKDTRRPLKLSKEFRESLNPFSKEFELPSLKHLIKNSKTQLINPINSFSYQTKNEDIDSNLHINNVVYIEFFLNSLESEKLLTPNLNLDVLYEKEAPPNSLLKGELYKFDKVYYFRIFNNEDFCHIILNKD